MKLKVIPEDFQVDELPIVKPIAAGRFTFYRLTKKGIGTPEAIETIRRAWNLAGSQVSYAGLKDRHAFTVQYLTIAGGPNAPLSQSSFDLEPLGFLPFAYSSQGFRGNRFTIVMRDLSTEAAERAISSLEALGRDGLPNYFDDQRFGSVGASGEFFAESWLRGNYERALWLAIADPNAHDRPGVRDEKAIVRDNWANWPDTKAKLDRSHTRSLVTYLVDHPDDFRGALARLNRTVRSLAFSAYQSHLWNVAVSRLLGENARPDQLAWYEFETARLPFPMQLDGEQRRQFASWSIPLPCARTRLTDSTVDATLSRVVAERGLEWNALRIKHMKDLFLSKGVRAARFVPDKLSHEVSQDERYPGRQKIRLSFELGKGSYATIVVKYLTRIAGSEGAGAAHADDPV